MDLEQIAIEVFLVLTYLLGPSDEHIKSLQLLDTGKMVNLHKFKMAAVQSFNLQITIFGLLVDPINVRAYYKQRFLSLTCLLGPSDVHIKSLQLLDTGKVINLHERLLQQYTKGTAERTPHSYSAT